jgi:hypothetical protein
MIKEIIICAILGFFIGYGLVSFVKDICKRSL